jgi:hypothetical protein
VLGGLTLARIANEMANQNNQSSESLNPNFEATNKCILKAKDAYVEYQTALIDVRSTRNVSNVQHSQIQT